MKRSRMKRTPISGERVSLHPKSLSDAARDYIWRKDPELAALNGRAPVKISFMRYLIEADLTQDSPDPVREDFSIKTIVEGRHIGNCAVYDVDRAAGEASVGIGIGDRRYWGQGYGSDAMNALIAYSFHHLGLRRLNLKTLERNLRAQKCFTSCGFRPCGSLLEEGNSYIMMRLEYDDYVKTSLASLGVSRTASE
jgi:RimJ/RimL family protein N-acetyltransferase